MDIEIKTITKDNKNYLLMPDGEEILLATLEVFDKTEKGGDVNIGCKLNFSSFSKWFMGQQ